jgi:hypothetical protein
LGKIFRGSRGNNRTRNLAVSRKYGQFFAEESKVWGSNGIHGALYAIYVARLIALAPAEGREYCWYNASCTRALARNTIVQCIITDMI